MCGVYEYELCMSQLKSKTISQEQLEITALKLENQQLAQENYYLKMEIKRLKHEGEK